MKSRLRDYPRSILLVIFFGFVSNSLASQNLVPNPGFEDVNVCCNWESSCCPEGWRYIKNVSGFFEENQQELAYSGNNFVEVILGGSRREYIQAKLLCPLEKGRKYKLSMYVRPIDFALNHLDIRFEKSITCSARHMPLGDNDTFLVKPPDLVFKSHNGLIYDRKHFLTKESNWIKLDTTFKAENDGNYIVIGNFLPKDKLKKKRIREKRKWAEYRIDSIILKPVNYGVKCDLDSVREEIYNNNIRHYCLIGSCDKLVHPDSVETSKNEKQMKKEYDTITFSNIHFKTDKSNIPPSFHSSLDTVVKYLKKHKVMQLKIHGHADERGTEKYNQQLSLERAEAVKQYLIKKGINEEIIKCEGFGSSRPLVEGTGEKSYRQNRRVEFIFVR